MGSNSEDLFRHIAVSASLPEIFHNFRVFTFDGIKTNTFSFITHKEYFLNGWKIDNWLFERMRKIYESYNANGNLKLNFEEILQRLENNHFVSADKFAQKVYDLINEKYIVLSEVYNEENYVSVDLEKFFVDGVFEWERFGEVVSIVTIILDNLLTTYQVDSPTRPINFNLINSEKLNFSENEIKKLNEFTWYYSLKTSLHLSKERGKFNSHITDFEKTDLFNWNVLMSDIKIYCLRNEINFTIKTNPIVSIVQIVEDKSEIENEMDYYYSRPKKLKLIEDDEMAPLIKGVKGAKEMCPVCFGYNVTYEAGVMCCGDCGWSACSIS